MTDPRDDVYILAALLADIERMLHPLPRGMRGKVRPEPNLPPPLPTPGSPASGRGGSFMPGGSPTHGSSLAPPLARAALPAPEKTAPRSPRLHGHDAPASRPDVRPGQESVLVGDAPRGPHAEPAAPGQGSKTSPEHPGPEYPGPKHPGPGHPGPKARLVSGPPSLLDAGFHEHPGAQPVPDKAPREAPAPPELHTPRLPAPASSSVHARTLPEQPARTINAHLDQQPETLATSAPPRLLPTEPVPIEQTADGGAAAPALDPPPAQHATPLSRLPGPAAKPVPATRPDNQPPLLRLAPPVQPDAPRAVDNAAASHHGAPPAIPTAAHSVPVPASHAVSGAAGPASMPHSHTMPASPHARAPRGRDASATEHLDRSAPARPGTRPRAHHRDHDPAAWIARGLEEPAAIQDENPVPAPEHTADSASPALEDDPTPRPMQAPEWLDMAAMDWPGEVSRTLRRAGRAWSVSRHDMQRMAGKLHIAYLDRALRRWR